MKTAIVYSNQEECKFFVVNGDLSKFNNVWVNFGGDPELQNELCNIFFDEETGEWILEEVTNEDFAAAIKDGAKVIKCGFIL